MQAEQETQSLNKFRKNTDVQATWREYGWTSPGDDPRIQAKWAFFRKLDTEQHSQPQQDQQESSNV